jgi:hypothetical protein
MVETAPGMWAAAATVYPDTQVVYWFSVRFLDEATGAGSPLALADGAVTHELGQPDPANVQWANRGILLAAQEVVAGMDLREDIANDPLASELMSRFASLLVREMLSPAAGGSTVGDTGLASVFRGAFDRGQPLAVGRRLRRERPRSASRRIVRTRRGR